MAKKTGVVLLVGICVGICLGEVQPTTSTLVIHADKGKLTIAPEIYGHFAEHLGRCIYEGFWVGEDSPIPNVRGIRKDVVEALRHIRIPVLRWPGGCFADDYHWMDGIGPREKRPTIVNVHWGGVTENNHFGTHEYFDLCEQLGCQPYICGNVGSGTVKEMRDWIEYITFDGQSPMADLRRANGRDKPWRIRYWGVGNENWGCGGNMTAEFYADLFRRYATYCRNLSGNVLFKIACGPNGGNTEWTRVLMQKAGSGRRPMMQGLALHYYCGSGGANRSATKFGLTEWFIQLRSALAMDRIITEHVKIMDEYDPDKRVALVVDEWGAWHAVEPGTNPGFLYQQNSLRDAMVAGVTLNIFNQHCDRVKMANIAQTVNVLQAMILTDGPRMILTPTYHVFDMYKGHQGATWLPTQLDCGMCGQADVQIPALSASASIKDGKILVTICNLDPERPTDLVCQLKGASASAVYGRILTAEAVNSHNTFDRPNVVEPKPFSGAKVEKDKVTARLPAKSIVALEIS